MYDSERRHEGRRSDSSDDPSSAVLHTFDSPFSLQRGDVNRRSGGPLEEVPNAHTYLLHTTEVVNRMYTEKWTSGTHQNLVKSQKTEECLRSTCVERERLLCLKKTLGQSQSTSVDRSRRRTWSQYKHTSSLESFDLS